MGQMFRLGLFTNQQLSKPDIAEKLWRLLAEPLINATRFDSVEDAENPFTLQSFNEAAQIYDEEGSLFVKGRRAAFSGSFTRQSEKLAMWNFFLDLKAVKGRNQTSWVNWFLQLCNALPVLYGFGCSVAEYDAKHLVRRVLPSGGRVTEWAGVSIAELSQYLPGLYWLTIFGSELVEAFGQDQLLALPQVKVFSLQASQIALCLDEPAEPTNMEQRLALERKIADQIGGQYFFDRDQLGRKHEPVPQLVAVLRQ